MKSLRYFLWGALIGAGLNAILVSALYLSPWRQTLYLKGDPSITAARHKLTEYRENLSAADLQLASVASLNSHSQKIDSVKTAQARAWREYKAWRNHLGELAKSHNRQSPMGFVAWCMSLIAWLLPLKMFLTLGTGLMAVLWANKRFAKEYRNSRTRTDLQRSSTLGAVSQTGSFPTSSQSAQAQLQEVVRRVAEISAQHQTTSPATRKHRTARVESHAAENPTQKRVALTPENSNLRESVMSPYARLGNTESTASTENPDPYTSPKPPKPIPTGFIPPRPRPASSRPVMPEPQMPYVAPTPLENLSPDDTAYIEVLGGWQDDMMAPVTARLDTRPPAEPVTSLNALVMQDEDNFQRKPELREPLHLDYKDPVAEALDQPLHELAAAAEENDLATLDNSPYATSPWAGIPETTEFEKLERQKEEVLKLARKGLTSSEISRRLKLGQDEVDVIIRMRREKG